MIMIRTQCVKDSVLQCSYNEIESSFLKPACRSCISQSRQQSKFAFEWTWTLRASLHFASELDSNSSGRLAFASKVNRENIKLGKLTCRWLHSKLHPFSVILLLMKSLPSCRQCFPLKARQVLACIAVVNS